MTAEDDIQKEVREWFKKYMPYGMTIIAIPKELVTGVEEFEPLIEL